MIPAIFSILFRAFGLGYTTRYKLACGFTVFTLFLTLVPAILIKLLGYGEYTHIASLVITLGGMSSIIFSKDSLSKTILLTLIVGQMATLISVPLNMVRHLLGLSYLTLDIMLLIVCIIVYFIAIRYWAKPMRFIIDNMYNKLKSAMMIPIITTMIIYLIPVYPARNFEFHPIYCTVIMVSIEICFFLYLYTLYRSLVQIYSLSEQKSNEKITRLSATLMEERLQIVNEAAYQQSLVAHDHRHFNNLILQLLELGHHQEAVHYLRQKTKNTTSKCKEYCENTAISAAVSHYVTLAENKGITTDIKLDIPKNLMIDSFDLAMVVSNLLENAIQGCDALPKSTPKIIHFSSRNTGRLLIQIFNPCTENTKLDRDGYPKTQTKDHGIGTKNVLAFTKKFNAEVFYLIENGNFIVRLLI